MYLSQLPPRLQQKKNVVAELNQLIREGTPETICVVNQEQLTEYHLEDEKHIRPRYVGIYVKNIKDKMRDVLGINFERPKYQRESHDRSTRRNREEQKPQKIQPGSDIVAQLVSAMEASNKQMISNMKNLFKMAPIG